jgi:hypothetical protein
MPPTDHASARAASADDRYGSARAARTTRIAAVVGAVVLAVALTLGILGWMQGTRTAITWTDIGYEHLDERTTAVEFQVSMEPGTAGTCQVQAQSASHGQVGYLEVPVGPDEDRYHAYRVEITTQEPAVSASVMGCTPDA